MKWCPLILMIIIAVAYYPTVFKIVASSIQVQKTKDNVLTFDWKSLRKNSQYGCPKNAVKLQDFLLKQSNIISSRAIFISGLAQQGIMRFMPTPVVYDESDHVANSFVVFVSLAMALSYFSGNIFFVFQIFIPDTIKSMQLPFAILIYPLQPFAFFVTLVVLLLSL